MVEVADEEDEKPPRHFCIECNILQPYRTKHCHECQRCVRKFDHHCFWIGSCVGELNHRWFWLFLLLEATFFIWSFLIAMSGYDKAKIYGEDEEATVQGCWTVLLILSFLFFLLTFILFVYHTYILCTGQTTWEHSQRDVIDFRKMYPKGFEPFNEGILRNLRGFFCHWGRVREWDVPTVKESENMKWFNLCENEYWSCC